MVYGQMKRLATKGVALAVGGGLLLALLCAGVCLLAPSAALAADDVSVTIEETTGTEGLSYDTHRIFSLTVNSDGTVSDFAWQDEATKNAVEGAIKSVNSSYAGTTAQEAADWIAANVTSATNPQASDNAHTLAKALVGLTPQAVLPAKTAVSLPVGYYLFVTTSTSLDATKPLAGTSPIFTLVSGTVKTITPKASVPTVTKKVKDSNGNWADSVNARTGQEITYKLTGTMVANVGVYEKYYYEFKDTLTAGLDYVDGSAKAYVGDTEISSSVATVAYDQKTRVLSVSFDETFGPANAGKEIRVEYTAKVNASAVCGTAGNANTASITYSNNPYKLDSRGTSVQDKVNLFTFKLHMVKLDKTTQVKLAGAKFTIKKGEDGYVQSDGSLAATSHEFESDANGEIDVSGIAEGVYTITETAAPTGYAAIDPFDLTITATHDAESDDPKLTKLEASCTHTVKADLDTGTITLNVSDTKQISLPITGRQGIALLVAAGLVLVSVSVASLVRRRRTER